MARKPSYDFERRERDKAKAAKTAERAEAKARKKVQGTDPEPDKPEGLETQAS